MQTAVRAPGASLQFAQSLFTRGTDVFGPKEVEQVFGIKISEDQVPPIPFSENELQTARRLGQVLVLQFGNLSMSQIYKMRQQKASDGRPLLYDTSWYNAEPFFTEDTLATGWKLVSREVLPSSLGQNYHGQTLALCGHLGEVFGTQITPEVRDAIDEFNGKTDELKQLMSKDWQKAAEQLANLKVNQLFRQTPTEVLWLVTLYEVINHERLLSGTYTWTKSRSSRGSLVYVGDFVERGVLVNDDSPGGSGSVLGVCFSRGGTAEL